ncbi:MAG: response regulator transcription factor [Muribaculaceae bacterium]|nr:response regulator transcription factor [Muribaculaceae bacterium]
MKTRVLIIEPSEVVVAGMCTLLHEVSRFKVLEPVRDIRDAAQRVIASRPDVVLLNPTLVENLTDVLGDRHLPVVALVYQYVEQLKLRRYDGVVDIRESRGTIAETLIAATTAAANPAQPDGDTPAGYELSARETAVLVLVAKGLTNKEIAEQLHVSPHTVMSHRKNIVHKTGIRSVAGLTVYAMLHNLIDESTLI